MPATRSAQYSGTHVLHLWIFPFQETWLLLHVYRKLNGVMCIKPRTSDRQLLTVVEYSQRLYMLLQISVLIFYILSVILPTPSLSFKSFSAPLPGWWAKYEAVTNIGHRRALIWSVAWTFSLNTASFNRLHQSRLLFNPFEVLKLTAKLGIRVSGPTSWRKSIALAFCNVR